MCLSVNHPLCRRAARVPARPEIFGALALLLLVAGCTREPAAPHGARVDAADHAGTARTELAATLKTIVVDGAFADWSKVLLNPLQVTTDGNSTGCNATNEDRDCGGMSNDNQDITKFAWTYDNTNIYTYLERAKTTSSVLIYSFIIDINADGRASASDKVLQVRWSGGGNTLGVKLCGYVPEAGSTSDPLACANAADCPSPGAVGLVDGYTMPGSIGTTGCWTPPDSGCGAGNECGGNLSGTGLNFEVSFPWSALGAVTPGSPLLWHVSSSTNDHFDAAADNVGGPLGVVGAFGVYAMSFEPSRFGSTRAGATVDYCHTITNTGQFPDRYELSASSATGAGVSFHVDVGGCTAGALIATDANGDGDFSDPGDVAPAADFDADGDGLPQLPAASAPQLAASGALPLLVRITAPGGLDGSVETTRLTASSVAKAAISNGSVVDTTFIGLLTVFPPFDRTGTADLEVPLGPHVVQNNQTSDDSVLLTVRSAQGWRVALHADEAGVPAAAATAIDSDGDGVWDAPLAPLPLGSGAQARFWLKVKIPAATAPETLDEVRLFAASATQPNLAPHVLDHLRVLGPLTLKPSYTWGSSHLFGAPGSSVYLPHTLVNSLGVSSNVSLSSATSPAKPSGGWSIQWWTDPDGDGSPADGAAITGPLTLAPFGGTARLVAEVAIDTAASFGTHWNAITTASDAGNGTTAAADDHVEATRVQTFRDPLFTIPARHFAGCATIYVRARGAPPPTADPNALAATQTTTYRLQLTGPGGTPVRTSAFPTDLSATGRGSYTLAASDPAGNWTATITGATGYSLSPLVIEQTGTLALQVPSEAVVGEPLAVSAVLGNSAAFSDFVGTTVAFDVLDPAGNPVPGLSDQIGPVNVPQASWATASTAWSAPAYTAVGDYQVRATWRTSCGGTLATATAALPRRPPAPTLTAPVAGAIVPTSTPTLSGLAAAGATVRVTLDGTEVGTAVAQADGSFGFPLVTALGEGPHGWSALQVVGGATSASSSAASFTVDSLAPVVTLTGTPPVRTRSTTADLTIAVNESATVECALDGAALAPCGASVSLTGLLESPAPHTFEARATDAAGHVGSASHSWTVDRTGPATALTTTPSAVTRETSATFAFTAEPGATFQCALDGAGAAPCDAGTATFDLTGDEGPHHFEVTASDDLGNVGAATSFDWIVDLSPPDVPIVSAPAAADVTSDATVAGTAEPGATLTVTVLEAGTVVATGTTVVTALGAWSFVPAGLADGSYTVVVVAADAAGNTGSSTSVVFTLDTLAPASPTIASPSSGAALRSSPVLSGSGPADSTLTLVLGGTTYADIPIDAGGGWTFTPPALADAAYTASATAVDAAGNASAAVTVSFTIDSLAPAAPAFTAPADGARVPALPTITGSAEPRATIAVSLDGAAAGTAQAADDGTWSLVLAGPLEDGSHTLTAIATDAAGNAGPAGGPRTFTLDTALPETTLTATPAAATLERSASFAFESEAGASFECARFVPPAAPVFAPCASPAAYADLPEGAHAFEVRAVDAAGNRDPTPARFDWRVDLTAPPPPVVAQPLPGATVPTTPQIGGSGEPGGTVTIEVDGGAPVVVPIGGDGTWTWTPPPLDDGGHSITITVTDPAGNQSPSTTVDFSIDTSVPTTTLTSTPAARIRETRATFAFEGSPAGVTFECAFDGAAFAACTSPWQLLALAEHDDYVFEVRARNAAGTVDPTPERHVWSVDLTAPTAPGVTSPTPGQTSASLGTLTGTAEPGATVVVSLSDGTSLGTTTAGADGHWSLTPTGSLPDGDYRLEIGQTDVAGNTGAVATVEIHLDSLPPETTIGSGPEAATQARDATFALSSDETSITYECRLAPRDADFSPCPGAAGSAGYTGLADGAYTLEVRARDAAGNADASPASFSWTVDNAAPAAPEVVEPAAAALRPPAFTASGTCEPGARVSLAVDGGAPAWATEVAGAWSLALAGLGDGAHELVAVATDAAGNASAETRVGFAVDAVAPTTTLTAAPPVLTNATSATFAFTSEPGATFECALESPPSWTSCSAGSFSASALVDGSHAFSVRATDAFGNVQAVPVVHVWEVDTAPPDTALEATPPVLTNATDATFQFSSEAGARFECALDGAAFAACASPHALTGLAQTPAPHRLEVRARDAAGNADPTPASFEWTVDTAAPETTLEAASLPAERTESQTAAFAFSSPDPGAVFECSLDGAPFATCTSTQQWTGLAVSAHAFEVRAVDAAQNADPTPARYEWTITGDIDADGLTTTTELTGTMTDPNDPDSDDDGLLDGVEVNGIETDPLDDDSDDDGLLDGSEDADHDGEVDASETSPLKADSDSDGLRDGLELGLTQAQGQDIVGFVADQDPSTTTDPTKADSDGGSVLDGFEDLNHDGKVDPDESDPLKADDDVDADHDGVSNVQERAEGTDPLDADSDDDGLIDGLEGFLDTDGDGRKDALDEDCDDDGLFDGQESGVTAATAHPDTDPTSPHFVADSDPTTRTYPKLADSDNDGLRDGQEDTNGNGRRDPRETDPLNPDSDSDGLDDGAEKRAENATNPLAADSDGDGLGDAEEDANQNGFRDGDESDPNRRDTDEGGVPDAEEVRRGTSAIDGGDDFGVAGGGCSCASSPRGGAGTGVLFVGLAAVLGFASRRRRALPFFRTGATRRRRGRTGACRACSPFLAVALALFASGAARAQTPPAISGAVDVQLYKPAPGADDILAVQGSSVGPHLGWQLGLSVHYARDPLVLVNPLDGTRVARLVPGQTTGDLFGAIGLLGWIELGLAMPVTLQQAGRGAWLSSNFAGGVSGFGAGDLRLLPKIHFLRHGGLGLAGSLAMALPTGDSSSFLGTGGFGAQPRLVADYEPQTLALLPSGTRFAANLGGDLGPTRQLLNADTGTELAYGFGLEVPLPMLSERIVALGNLNGSYAVGSSSHGAPLELLAAARIRATDSLMFHVGGGRGLTSGVGSPAFRVLAGATWVQRPAGARAPRDEARVVCQSGPEDFDGFQDDDACADPDNDADGVADATDECPFDPAGAEPGRAPAGCPGVALPYPPLAALQAAGDGDADGRPDPEDRCPAVAEDLDGFEDADGCAEPDNDRDGIADPADRCPLEAEVINGIADEDGCPDKGKSKVLLQGDKIVILEKVFFATGKADILPKSFGLLDQVAALMKANPRVLKVRVEGHTDDRGDDARNLELSQRRAERVRERLVSGGIETARLDAVGYGETKPVQPNKTALGREANRRVEFTVIETQPIEVEVEEP